MRYPVTALTVAFPQPKALQTSSHAQGGILFRFGPTTSVIVASQQDATIITGVGPALNLSLPASIEPYPILLVLHCMVVSLAGQFIRLPQGGTGRK